MSKESKNETIDPFQEAIEKICAEVDQKYHDEKNCAEYYEPLTDEELRVRKELIKKQGDDMRRRMARELIIMQPRWKQYKKQYDDYVFGRSEILPKIPK